MLLLANAPMLAALGGVVSALALDNLYLLFTAPLFTAGLLLCSQNLKKFKIKGQAKVFVILILIALCCSVRFYCVFNQPEFKSSYIKAIGTVRLVRPWGRAYRAVIDTKSGNFLITLHLPSLFPGELIEIQGETAQFKDNNKFSELRYWRARDVQARLTRVKINELGVDKFSFAYLRFKIANYLSLNMPHFTQAYLKAAWLGERDAEINKFHLALGTSNLLAVSGFHVGIAAFIAYLIFGKKRVILISSLIWLYVMLTGAAASALRAALMFQTAIFTHMIGRPSNSLNGVSVAAIILLFHSPYIFWDISFRLSVISVLTIAAFIELSKITIIKFLDLPPIVTLTTFAEAAYIFKSVPVAGLVLNLFAPVFFSMAFSLSSLAVLLYFLNIPFAEILINACEYNFIFFHDISNKILQAFPILNYKIPWRTPYAFISAFAFIFILCLAVRLELKQALITALCLAAFAFIIFL